MTDRSALPSPPTALVTGSSGFIGFHVSQRLLAEGFRVIGFDAMTDYYDVSLKEARQTLLTDNPNFEVVNARLETPEILKQLFETHRPDVVIHLAAQAGVRYSLEEPRSYLDSNVAGTFELLEAARAYPPKHMLLASTSSVFGANREMPYREDHMADHPLSFYAATKKAGEAMAHSYAHLFGIPTTMFRFFTVYGPWGRPDMALFKFVRAILDGQPIDVYNNGNMRRDFTYIDDLVEAIFLLIHAVPGTGRVIEGDSLSPAAPWRVVNIGNSEPILLTDFIDVIEKVLGRTARRHLMPIQPGDLLSTWADGSLLQEMTGYAPKTDLETGVAAFVAWYLEHYKIAKGG